MRRSDRDGGVSNAQHRPKCAVGERYSADPIAEAAILASRGRFEVLEAGLKGEGIVQTVRDGATYRGTAAAWLRKKGKLANFF